MKRKTSARFELIRHHLPQLLEEVLDDLEAHGWRLICCVRRERLGGDDSVSGLSQKRPAP